MESTLAIQAVASLTGLSAHTLRYYERIGLIDPVPRTPVGYRCYAETHINQLMTLKHLRGIGMTIRQLDDFMARYRQGALAECYALLKTHQACLTTQLATIQHYLTKLDVNLAIFRGQAAT